MASCGRQLGALLRKNWIIKKRHIIGSILEVLLPCVVICGLIFIHSLTSIRDWPNSLNMDKGYAFTHDRAISEFESYLQFVNGHIAIIPGNHPTATKLKNYLADPALTLPVKADRIILDYNTHDEFNHYVVSTDYAMGGRRFYTGAVVLDDLAGPDYRYTLRFNSSLDGSLKYQTIRPTNDATQDKIKVTYDEKWYQFYTSRGFVTLQTILDNFILHTSGAFVFPSEPTAAVVDAQRSMYLQPFPTQAHTQDNFADFVGGFLGMFFTLVFIWPVTRIVSNIVEEKELKIKQGMIMMGLKETALIMSWWLTYAIMFALTSGFIVLLTFFNLYKNSHAAYIYFFFFLFCLCVFSFSFLMSTVFAKAKTGSTFAAIIFLVLFFLYFLVESDNTERGSKMLASLSPTINLSLGATLISRLESSGLGVNADTADLEIGNWTYNSSMGMFIVDTILYFLLGLYFQQIIPGEYGIPRGCCFCLTPSFWCGTKKDRNAGVCPCGKSEPMNTELDNVSGGGHNVANNFQHTEVNEEFTRMESSSGIDSRPLVQIRNLRKTFQGTNGHDFVAVKGMTLDMFEGQVFGLLGENGAGKSTIINCLTGLYPPSDPENSGQLSTAFVNGFDIRTEMHAIQQCQGVCMQHDILYAHLSVKEHLELYCSIKGVPSEQVDQAVTDMIDQIGLGEYGDNKANNLAGTLSGGQMRKLSVGIALLNNPKIVVLDEPSSGMDVSSQRFIWEVILKAKEGRTIILTSHFMEEVETLADNIAIMAGGKLMCAGSSLYLKEQFGVGYTMTVAKQAAPEDDIQGHHAKLWTGCTTLSGSRFAEFMAQRYPFAELVTDAAGEISFRMPFSDAASFPDMFEYFDAYKRQLGIVSYGVSATTLTEVFLKVVQMESREGNFKDEEDATVHMVVEDVDWAAIDSRKSEPTKWNIFWRHFGAMFIKRVHTAKRDKRSWMWSVLYPSIIIFISLLSQELSDENSFPIRPMEASIYEYSDFEYSDDAATPEMRQIFSKFYDLGVNPVPVTFGVKPTRTEFQTYLLNSIHTKSMNKFRSGSFLFNQMTNFPVAGPGLFPTLDFDLYFNYTAQESVPAYINMMNTALLRTAKGSGKITTESKPFNPTAKQQAIRTVSVALSICIGFSFVTAVFVGYLVKEVEEKSKQLQLINGTSVFAYWTATYLWDLINYVVPVVCLYILLFIFGVDVYTEGSGFGAALFVLILYGFAGSSFAYCLSFLFDTASTAQNTTLMINFLTSVIFLIIVVILLIMDSTKEIGKVLRFFFRLTPSYCLADSLALIALRDATFPGESYFSMNVTGWNIIFLFFDAIAYFALLILFERLSANQTLDWFLGGCGSVKIAQDEIDNTEEEEEEDVAAEREKILRGECDDPHAYAIVLKGLRKVYPSRMGAKPHVAVNNLYYAIKRGECLGFLGANGAGKSTAMKMLIGEVPPTSGSATLAGFDIHGQALECRKHMGYVPQFDALMPLLTGREHLELYARIKLVNSDDIPSLTNYLISKLGLSHLADRPAGTYSGGNKRKLSCALAICGNPHVVFLDEPSTGVDPSSRRFIWKLISDTMKNRSLILTTHNMEEAEALSNRITILTSGRLRALGTTQYLKSKYGQGWQVVLKVKRDAGAKEAAINWFQQNYPGTQVIEAHTVNIKLRIPNANLSLANFFRTIEYVKDSIGISTYSVSEYTLEQLFVHFVEADIARKAKALGAHKRQF